MSDITRCPNCQTAFRVTEAQLTAHRGKVRCGRCAFVFNARECFESEQLAETVSSTPVPAHETHSDHQEPSPTPVYTPQEEARVDFVAMAMQSPASAIEHIASPAEEAVVDIPSPPEPPPQPAASIQPEYTEPAEPAEPETHQAEPQAEPQPYRPIYIEDDQLLRAPPPRSRWQRIYAPICVLLLLCFAAQWAYYQRTAISMELPWLRPKLISACQILGCSMPLPKNTEMLRSEWSELSYVPDFPNIIQLNASLRNLAQYEQALPLLEVTLTDDQERVVLKKVFKPSEYLSHQDKNRLQFDAQDELRAFLQIDLGELHSTAYSIYWFYP
jgi:predicted Zn finger-like uncharacterized protein